jgi:hypothetical protein
MAEHQVDSNLTAPITEQVPTGSAANDEDAITR